MAAAVPPLGRCQPGHSQLGLRFPNGRAINSIARRLFSRPAVTAVAGSGTLIPPAEQGHLDSLGAAELRDLPCDHALEIQVMTFSRRAATLDGFDETLLRRAWDARRGCADETLAARLRGVPRATLRRHIQSWLRKGGSTCGMPRLRFAFHLGW